MNSERIREAELCGLPARRRALVLLLAVGCLLTPLLTGCARSSISLQGKPSEQLETGLGRVSVLECGPDAMLAVDVDGGQAALLNAAGEELWRREFPGASVVMARLTQDGSHAYLSTMSLSDGPDAWAMLLSRDGDVVWETREQVVPGFFDACLSADGSSLISFFVPDALEGRPAAYEVVSVQDGGVQSVPGDASAPLVALSATPDLSRVIVSRAVTDPAGQGPCDSTVTLYEGGEQLDSHNFPATFTTGSLSHSGSLVFEMVDGMSLQMSRWPATPLWTMQSPFVGQAQFSEDDSLVLTAGMSSTQTQIAHSYSILLEVRDANTGKSLWQDACASPTVLFPVASADLSHIALVPLGGDGTGYLYARGADAWDRQELPEGSAAVGFGSGDTIYIGTADGAILCY